MWHLHLWGAGVAWRSDTEGQGLNTQGLKAGRLKEIDDVDKNTLHLGLFYKHTGTRSQTHVHTSNVQMTH